MVFNNNETIRSTAWKSVANDARPSLPPEAIVAHARRLQAAEIKRLIGAVGTLFRHRRIDDLLGEAARLRGVDVHSLKTDEALGHLANARSVDSVPAGPSKTRRLAA